MDLLRSLLYVPGDSSRKLASARNLHPDALVFDLEDAVSPDRKLEARRLIQEELKSAAAFSAKIFIRVNRFGSPFLADDLRAAVHPGVYGIVLPKCNEASEVVRVQETILGLEMQSGMAEGVTKLVLMIETAKGVANARDLARASSRVIALVFGAEDYCADMGIARTTTGDEVAFARSLIALAAKAEGLEAIDGVFTDFKDTAGLFEETQRIKQMGFTGKTLIHPQQIDVVHSALAPSEEEIAWAEEVVSTFQKAGEGVVVVRGKMIDEPVVAQARRILQQSMRNGQTTS
jgi:citrate lyase subunit beta / citryl-CoA lyase